MNNFNVVLSDINEEKLQLAKEELSKISGVCDALVLSPGIPVDHPLAVHFKRSGRAVIGESELAARYLRCPLIAVTGTNGKTTTVSMMKAILCEAGINAKACGNIGEPMVNFTDLDEESVAVGEISSFLLYSRQFTRPFIDIANIYNNIYDILNIRINCRNSSNCRILSNRIYFTIKKA